MKTQTLILWDVVNRKKKMKKVLYQTKVISRYYEQENFKPKWAESFVLLKKGEGSGR